MSFRDNLQHLRAARNMTQEQLAMLLGVSRQSVSKWEAERAYPEMDKLLALCDLFGCTLDDLVTGDMTGREVDGAVRMPQTGAPQDVTGYDEAMRSFAGRAALGFALPFAVVAAALPLWGLAFASDIDLWSFVGVVGLVSAAVCLALVLPAFSRRRGFLRAHPFVEDFYTAEQKARVRAASATEAATGIGCFLVGCAVAVLAQKTAWLAGAAALLGAGLGILFIVHSRLMAKRCDLEAYNRSSLRVLDEADIEALGDEALGDLAREARRDRALLKLIMSASTAVGLALLFVPAFGAGRWFWIAWPIGGLAYGAIRAFRLLRGGA